MKILVCNFVKNRAINALLSVAFTGMMLCFSGCFDPIEIDLSNSGFLSDGSGGSSSSYTFDTSTIGLTIDSAINIETNSVTLIFKVIPQSNVSIAVLKGTRVTIERTDSTNWDLSIRKFTTGPDTVDFQKGNPYQFQLTIDSLSSGAAYRFYASRAYSDLQKSDSTYCVPWTQGRPYYGCEYTVQTKN